MSRHLRFSTSHRESRSRVRPSRPALDAEYAACGRPPETKPSTLETLTIEPPFAITAAAASPDRFTRRVMPRRPALSGDGGSGGEGGDTGDGTGGSGDGGYGGAAASGDGGSGGGNGGYGGGGGAAGGSGRGAGFYRFLTKPVSVDQLTAVLEELLVPAPR